MRGGGSSSSKVLSLGTSQLSQVPEQAHRKEYLSAQAIALEDEISDNDSLTSFSLVSQHFALALGFVSYLCLWPRLIILVPFSKLSQYQRHSSTSLSLAFHAHFSLALAPQKSIHPSLTHSQDCPAPVKSISVLGREARKHGLGS